MKGFIKNISLPDLVNPRWSAAWLIIAILSMYSVMPIAVSYYFPNPYLIELATISAIGCFGIAIGFMIPVFDNRFRSGVFRFRIDSNKFHVIIWIAFFIFMIITFTTAKSIPILSSLSGADAIELSQQRGEFLKAREGLELPLIYISNIFTSALLPYSLVKLFIDKSKYRFLLALVFLLFSVSFLQKSLFLNIFIPIFYFVAIKSKHGLWKIILIMISCIAILYLLTKLASTAPAAILVGTEMDTAGDFFSANYTPGGSIEMLLWRSAVIPIVTATDTLAVFHEQFNSQLMYGATSSFLAGLFQMERIPLEVIVHAYQFGGWNSTGNANSMYALDAFVNFGWTGVLLISTLVGQTLRWFKLSKDLAFKSLWMLYCFALFSSPLIGTLLSNGFFIIFAMIKDQQ